MSAMIGTYLTNETYISKLFEENFASWAFKAELIK